MPARRWPSGSLRAAGLTDVILTTYPGARHEVFNETNRDEVITNLRTWLDKAIAASG